MDVQVAGIILLVLKLKKLTPGLYSDKWPDCNFVTLLLVLTFSFNLYSQSNSGSLNCTKLGGYGTGILSFSGEQCQVAPVFLPEFPSCDEGAYELVFDDEFDSTAIDTSKWHAQSFAQGAVTGNPFQHFDTMANVVVSGGYCSIVGF